MIEAVLFDLDGTLTDPKAGICGSVAYALDKFGIVEKDLSKLEPFIGPPLVDSFMKFYGFSKEHAQEAVGYYRERFAPIGLYENEIYPGVREMLARLKQQGIRLGIASSKPKIFVEKILAYFHIDTYFDVVQGSELDGRKTDKAELLTHAVRDLGLDDNSTKELKILMVGDRIFDVNGAHAMGFPCIAVSYGYAPEGELEASGAEAIAHSVKELEEVILSWK